MPGDAAAEGAPPPAPGAEVPAPAAAAAAAAAAHDEPLTNTYAAAFAHAVGSFSEAVQDLAEGVDLGTLFANAPAAAAASAASGDDAAAAAHQQPGGGGSSSGQLPAQQQQQQDGQLAPPSGGGVDGSNGGAGEDRLAQQKGQAGDDELDQWEQLDIGMLFGDAAGGGTSTTGTSSAAAAARARLLARRRLEAVRERLLVALHPTLVDKLAYVLGSGQVWAMAYLLGYCPSKFYIFYTLQTVALMSIRYIMYKPKRIHYYMLDMCYFSNLLLLAHIWLLPRSASLAKITHAFSAGPLAWSIAAFRNSLVLHDLDRLTSVMIHLAPSLVSWTLRWHPDATRFGPRPGASEDAVRAWQQGSVLQLVLLPMVPYLLWSSSYYFYIFHLAAERIRSRGYTTLFTWVTSTKSGVFAAITARVPPEWRPQVYLLLHWCFCWTTFLLAWVCWSSFLAHTLLITSIALVSAWNGAGFMFHVFSKRYASELAARQAAHAQLRLAKQQ